MGFDQQWADDFARRYNQRHGYPGGFEGIRPEYVIYDEAFGNIGHPGKYRDAYGNPRYGPPSLARVYRCQCGVSEADHDDDGKAYALGVGCAPYPNREPDPLKEMIKSWL